MTHLSRRADVTLARFNPHPAFARGVTGNVDRRRRYPARFNPHPAFARGVTRDALREETDPEGFNPHPAFARGVTRQITGLYDYYLFQSAPRVRTRGDSPGRLYGDGPGSFNPHPAFARGVTS